MSRQVAAALRALADELEGKQTLPASPVRVHPGTSIPWVTGNFSLDLTAAQIGMHRAEPTPARDSALAEWDARWNMTWHAGQFPVTGLTLEDKAYLAQQHGPVFDRTGKDLRFAGVVSGTTAEINRAFAEGQYQPVREYHGPIRAVVEGL